MTHEINSELADDLSGGRVDRKQIQSAETRDLEATIKKRKISKQPNCGRDFRCVLVTFLLF